MQCIMLEAKNQLSKLAQAALACDDVVIASKIVPVVRQESHDRRYPFSIEY